MPQVTYNSTSPYFTTGFSQFYLDVMNNRPIPAESDDLPMIINTTYQYRPDLLAYDLYGVMVGVLSTQPQHIDSSALGFQNRHKNLRTQDNHT